MFQSKLFDKTNLDDSELHKSILLKKNNDRILITREEKRTYTPHEPHRQPRVLTHVTEKKENILWIKINFPPPPNRAIVRRLSFISFIRSFHSVVSYLSAISYYRIVLYSEASVKNHIVWFFLLLSHFFRSFHSTAENIVNGKEWSQSWEKTKKFEPNFASTIFIYIFYLVKALFLLHLSCFFSSLTLLSFYR